MTPYTEMIDVNYRDIMDSITKRMVTAPIMQRGPTEVTIQICKGCCHLKEEYWKDYLDNDETDSGTMLHCGFHDPPKLIAMYGSINQRAPDWCPFRK